MSANHWPNKEIFDFNIDLDDMLERPRIDEIFVKGMEYPLTIVHAPAGYSKTTSSLQFAKSLDYPVIYMSLNDLDRDIEHFWEHLAGLYTKLSESLGQKMSQLGFPNSTGVFLQYADLLMEVVSQQEHVLIIDDYHVAECPELEILLEKVSGLRLKGFNVLLLSRTVPRICCVDMKVKGLIYEITKEQLRFDLPELMAYYHQNCLDISEEAAVEIGNFTEGWASAVFLSSLYYRKNPDQVFNLTVFDIDRLIESAIYRDYDEELREFLLKLSILERFDIEICGYLTGSKNAYELLSRVINGNSLVKISEDRQCFEMHRLFRDFLQNKLGSRSSIDKRELHIRAGEFFEYKNDLLMALMHFDYASDYDKMVNLILRNRCATTFSNQELVSILKYMEKIPHGFFRKYPMLLLIWAMSLTRTEHAAKSLELVAEVERYCTNPGMPEEVRNTLLGESAIVKALMSFNNVTLMRPLFIDASRLLPQGSQLLGEKTSFTFGSPSILYLYYRRPGGLDEDLEIFLDGFPYWEKVSSCGFGADYLLKAEAAFERGDYENAEQDAFRAIFRAEEKNQNSIVIAAKLLIIKICAARGKYSSASVVLRDMRELMNYRKALIYLSTIDMCTATFCLLTGDLEGIPQWLSEGQLAVSAVNRAGFGIEYLIYCGVLLSNKEHLKVESVVPRMFEVYGMFSNQYGIIRAHLVSVISNFHLYGLDKAITALNEGFRITEADKLIAPYLEYGEYLLPVFKEILKNYDDLEAIAPREWFDDTTKKIKEYQKSLSRFRAGFLSEHPEKAAVGTVKLTKREREILELIIQGYSGEEIARKLYVTPINIRVITSKIYKKLGVNSRAAAVRVALDNGLVKMK